MKAEIVGVFSADDIALFQKYKLAILRGIDEKYVYELNRNAADSRNCA